MSDALGALALGGALGVQFDPVASIVGASLAAALCGYPSAPRRRLALSAVVLLCAWFLRDGLRLMAETGLLGGSASSAVASVTLARWETFAAWALAGSFLGYVLPTWAGAFVGVRVTRGTGYLSAAVVAATASGTLSSVSPAAQDLVARLTAS